MARAFIIRPFGKKKDSAGKEIDPALIEVKLGGERPARLSTREISGLICLPLFWRRTLLFVTSPSSTPMFSMN
jgi:hypothetical protein